MPIIALTGAASGIGAAIRARLERAGTRVVGIDLRGTEVTADLSTPDGRRAAVAGVLAAAPALDGVVACAGLGPQFSPASTIVAVNYFGAVEVIAGLRDALAAGGAAAAVAISSNSATIPGSDTPIVEACLAGHEAEALRLAETLPGAQVYGGSKLALARWVRRNAPRPEWAGRGIRLNAVAPGAVQTPLLQGGLDDAVLGPAIRNFPIPTGGFGAPEQIAAAVAFLLGPDAAFCCGSVLFVDGGTDALLRPDAL